MPPRILSYAPAVLLLAAASALRADDVPVGQIAAVVDLKKIDLAKAGGTVPGYYGRLSADGARLAAITLDGGAFWLIDAVNGKQIHFLRGDDFTPNVHFNLSGFSPDGKLVTAEGGGNVLILDAESGKQLLSIKAPAPPGPSHLFSADGKWLAVYGARQGYLYNAATGEQAAMIFDPKDYGKNNQLLRVAFSPDGKRLLVCEKVRIRLKESDTGKDLQTIETTDKPAQALFSPDGKQFMAWVGTQCRVWSLDGKELKSLPALGKGNLAQAFSPDGALLAGIDGSQKVWSTDTGKEAIKLADPGTQKGDVASLAFSADGKRLAAWCQDAAKVVWWQVAK